MARKRLENKLKNVKTRLQNENLSASQRAQLESRRQSIRESLRELPRANGDGRRGSGGPSRNPDGSMKTGPGAAADAIERVGTRANELTDILTPELNQDGFLGRQSNPYQSEMDTLRQRLAQLETQATQTSPEMQDVLGRMQAGLSGFSTPEEEALRLKAMEEINGGLRSGLMAAQGLNLSRNLRGGVAANNFAPALTEAIRQRRGLAADIFNKQIDERARRLGDYRNAILERDTGNFNRLRDSLTMSQGALERQQVLDADTQRYNLDNQAKELAARLAGRGVNLDLIRDEQARRQEINDYDQALKEQQTMYEQLFG